MKKALALVLALVLALSMAVSAFALDVVELGSTSKAYKDGRINLDVNTGITFEDKTTYFLASADAAGEAAYMLLDTKGAKLENVAVTATGCVDAKVVDFDPATMYTSKVIYQIFNEEGAAIDDDTLISAIPENGTKSRLELINAALNATLTADKLSTNYDLISALAKMLTNETKGAVKYTVKAVDANNKPVDYKVLVIAVEENYSVSYKMGSFKITATDVTNKKAPVALASPVYEVISDVTIFEYEEVKWAAENNGVLEVGEDGYSDYTAAKSGYGTDKYVPSENRTVAGASVVSTTAFRAIAGKDLVVEANDVMEVTLLDIVAGQKGVNFAAYEFKYLNAEGKDITLASTLDKQLATIEFGFLGDQVVKGAFEITVDLGYDWFELREKFGIKVEEEDILTYYVLKDGKVIESITVDYMTDEVDEDIELVIKGENSNLGEYAIAIEVPAAEVETETEANPNTGAESVVGVVAALAVVSLASAAAVSLKK